MLVLGRVCSMTCYEQIQNIAGSFHLTLPPATIQKTIPESQKEDLDTEQVMLQHMQQLCPTLQDCCGAVGCCILRNICIPMLSSMACGIPCHLAYIFWIISIQHQAGTAIHFCLTRIFRFVPAFMRCLFSRYLSGLCKT